MPFDDPVPAVLVGFVSQKRIWDVKGCKSSGVR